ncbi:unnamed protein product, partial [Dovyalis caffra]
MAVLDKSKLNQSFRNQVNNGVQSKEPNSANSILSSVKQRSLSFIFQGICGEEIDKVQV